MGKQPVVVEEQTIRIEIVPEAECSIPIQVMRALAQLHSWTSAHPGARVREVHVIVERPIE